MRPAIRLRLARQRQHAAARAQAIATRPYEARRGIHGPLRFRTLFGAQGWVDTNWPRGEPVIVDRLTGSSWRRDEAGAWLRDGGPEPEADAELEPADAPYWMRPL